MFHLQLFVSFYENRSIAKLFYLSFKKMLVNQMGRANIIYLVKAIYKTIKKIKLKLNSLFHP